MKKAEQIKINEKCLDCIDNVNAQILNENGIKNWHRLRSCNAEVGETSQYYILRSYNTLIAFIDKTDDTLYDVLRFVYGYTATSAQNIAKFRHDYGMGKWGCDKEYRYYNV